MKIIHLSDLHLGKRVNEFSMIEDQRYILNQILDTVEAEMPCAVVIAGDVYDKSIPPAEAVELFDSFLTELFRLRVPTFVISGNHDSAERVSFGSRLMEGGGIYISRAYEGAVSPITLVDEQGKVNFYMLPFIKPSHVRHFHDAECETYTDAVKLAIEAMKIDKSERNILIAHQFVTGATRCESEEISVGGLDNVDSAVFADFDYVALGHIHRPQNCTSEKIRYCGSPLKYSFSEANDQKSITLIEMAKKGEQKMRLIPFVPRTDMVELRGKYEELMRRDFYEAGGFKDAYVHITLTDEEDVLDAIGKLRTVYKNLMKLDYDNQRTRNVDMVYADAEAEKKTPMELFSDLYEMQNNKQMSPEQCSFMTELIEKIWEVDV